jgi:hypothetical protein
MLLFFLRGVALIAPMMTLAFASTTATAFDYLGFTLGMSEANAIALANRSGYQTSAVVPRFVYFY